jgi:flagellar biogenesis protein FliO
MSASGMEAARMSTPFLQLGSQLLLLLSLVDLAYLLGRFSMAPKPSKGRAERRLRKETLG